jgi:hypothetical protein
MPHARHDRESRSKIITLGSVKGTTIELTKAKQGAGGCVFDKCVTMRRFRACQLGALEQANATSDPRLFSSSCGQAMPPSHICVLRPMFPKATKKPPRLRPAYRVDFPRRWLKLRGRDKPQGPDCDSDTKLLHLKNRHTHQYPQLFKIANQPAPTATKHKKQTRPRPG